MRNLAILIVALLAGVLITVLLIRNGRPAPRTTQPDRPATTESLEAPELPPVTPPPSVPKPPEMPPATPPVDLSILSDTPEWLALSAYQHTISRSDFERLLTDIFTTDETWREYITISDTSAEIITSTEPAALPFTLKFATPGRIRPALRSWKAKDSLPPHPPGKPLSGLHIAVDPGHIGGDWAKIEERWFQIADGTPVTEGGMTLMVAEILKPLLEGLGAEVTLVRTKNEPITSLRPEDLAGLAGESIGNDPEAIRKFSEKLFYRTAEIRARANLVNETIKPDLVLCLHFNAEAWGDPSEPTLVPRTHFHVLLNGAYTSSEVQLADQRFAMLEKLLQRTHEEEALVGKTVAATFAKISGLPAYSYSSDGKHVRAVSGSPYLYARNLLANRLYDCPVLFMEPYVMNSTIDYPRIQAGDYQGLREINGKQQPSIFREYAEALAQGLANHYSCQ